MSALMKMLGVDKMLEGVDIGAMTEQFQKKMQEDQRMAEAIMQIAKDIQEIKAKLGIYGEGMKIESIEYREGE